MTAKLAVLPLVAVLSATGCGPSEQQRARWDEEKRIECIDKICVGDVIPEFDPMTAFAFKLNNDWFIGPRDYGGFGGSIAFFWPSKTPARGANASRNAPEFRPSAPGKVSNFYEVAIEIFLRSTNIPSPPYGYALIELAEMNHWIASRKTLRPGLDAITMKDVVGPSGGRINHVTYYVATELKGTDGLPPVATCATDDPRSSGGTGFMWRPGIWVGTRMNQKHCADWPEIYVELVRVLQLIKKV